MHYSTADVDKADLVSCVVSHTDTHTQCVCVCVTCVCVFIHTPRMCVIVFVFVSQLNFSYFVLFYIFIHLLIDLFLNFSHLLFRVHFPTDRFLLSFPSPFRASWRKETTCLSTCPWHRFSKVFARLIFSTVFARLILTLYSM